MSDLKFPLVCHYRIITNDLPDIKSKLLNLLNNYKVSSQLELASKSTGGKYLSFSVSVNIESKEIMNSISSKLQSIDGVKVVL